MKHILFALMLMGMLCFSAKTTGAYPLENLIEPKCSVCNGRGFSEDFWGGRIACKNCGGDGKTFRWWMAGIVVVMLILIGYEKQAQEKGKS